MSMPSDDLPSIWGTLLGRESDNRGVNGTTPQWRPDDMCTRVMAAYYKVGGGDAFATFVNFDSWLTEPYARVPLLADSVPALVNEDVQ